MLPARPRSGWCSVFKVSTSSNFSVASQVLFTLSAILQSYFSLSNVSPPSLGSYLGQYGTWIRRGNGLGGELIRRMLDEKTHVNCTRKSNGEANEVLQSYVPAGQRIYVRKEYQGQTWPSY